MKPLKSRPIYFMVDTSYQMHQGRMSASRTPLAKICVYLSQFCKRIDEQLLYMDRVKIYFADKLLSFEPGKAESMFNEFTNDSNENFKLVQKSPISMRDYWQSVIMNESDNAVFFLLTGYAPPRTSASIDYFARFENVFLFDFMSAQMTGFDSEQYPSEDDFLKKLADETHNSFIDEYVTGINFGLVFNGKFWSLNKKKRQLSVNKIVVLACTNEKPLQHLKARSRDFLFPLPNTFTDKNGSHLSNINQYFALKQLLGDKNEWNKSRKKDKPAKKATSKKKGVHEGVHEEVPEKISEEVPEEVPVFEKPNTEQKTPTKPGRRPKTAKVNSDDEEYTPPKNVTRKPTRGRGGKRGAHSSRGQEATPSKPVTRSTGKRGRPKKVKEEEQDETVILEEKPVVESEIEVKKEEQPNDQQSNNEELKNDQPKDVETKDELPTNEQPKDEQTKDDQPKDDQPKLIEEHFSRFLIGCAVERVTNIRRPVVMRLRGIHENDKVYQDLEKVVETPSDSNTDQPQPQIETSSDVCPVDVLQSFTPNATIQEVDCLKKKKIEQPEEKSNNANHQNLRLSDSNEEPDVKKAKPEEPIDFGQPESPTMNEDFDIPQEPSEEELVSMQVEPIKCIPVTSEWEREQKQMKEEVTKAQKADDNTKYIEVIVLDTTWDEFITQCAFKDDTDSVTALAEDEKTLVGEPQSNDYTRLAGWYSPVAMLFYINKMLRALRKPNERRAMFEQEISNMTDMVVNGQNADLAFQFGYLFRSESMESFGYLHPNSENAGIFFDQLGAHYYIPKRVPVSHSRYYKGGESNTHHHNWHRSSNNY